MSRLISILTALAAACALGAGSAAAATPAAYCVAKGGTVSSPTLPNGTSAPLCTFTRASDGTTIAVGLGTLASRRQSLAVRAYLRHPKIEPVTGGANPASVYCAQLGGSEPLEGICRFRDGSMIDSWGLTYHTEGIVRGRDLTSLFRSRAT